MIRFCSIFSQLLQLFPKEEFQQAIKETRMEDNALYGAVGERKLPLNRHIHKEELIELRGSGAIEKRPYPLRRIEAYDPKTQKPCSS